MLKKFWFSNQNSFAVLRKLVTGFRVLYVIQQECRTKIEKNAFYPRIVQIFAHGKAVITYSTVIGFNNIQVLEIMSTGFFKCVIRDS